MAILRAVNEKQLSIKVEIDENHILDNIKKYKIPTNASSSKELVFDAYKDGLKRLLLPTLKREAISNLKENKGTFSQINDLNEIVVELIEKAQTTKEIKNPSSPQIIYNVLEHICFGCGIQWCLHQIEDVRLEFIQSLKAILIV